MSTKERILDAAERRIRHAGYSEMSIRDIATDVGVKGSSVHYHFPTKEALGAAVAERYSQRFFERLMETAPEDAPPQARLDAFANLHEAALLDGDQTCLCAILGAQSLGLPRELTLAVQRHTQACLNWLASIAPPDQPHHAYAAGVFATVQGGAMVATLMHSPKMFRLALAPSGISAPK